MSDRRPAARLAALLLAFLLLAAACGEDSGSGGGEATGDTAVPTPTESVDVTTTTALTQDSSEGAASAAAGLRADLTTLLVEHVYLVGVASDEALAGARGSDSAAAAAAVLDANGVDMSVAVGSFYGTGAGEQFLEVWRAHLEEYLDYAVARSESDSAGAAAAEAALDEFTEDIGEFFNGVNDRLGVELVADQFGDQVDDVLVALDARATDAPEVWTDLRVAAQVSPDTATTLAEGIVAQKMLEGDVLGAPATLRADLTNYLVEHVHLTEAAIDAAVVGGPSSPDAADTLDAVRQNTEALADTIGEVYGIPVRQQFLTIWDDHIDAFVDYADAASSGDADALDESTADLDQFREDIGALIESYNEFLSQEAVAAELQPYVDATLLAIDAVVDGDDEQFELIREAGQTMPSVALTMASNFQLDL